MNGINAIKGNYPQNFCGANIAKRFAKMGEIGEGASIACDFLGKAIIVPAVIMSVSKEPKEKKEFSAFKNPVAAVIQLALEVPVLIGGSKVVEKLADKGYFDKENSAFTYNQKKMRKSFVSLFKKLQPQKEEFIEKINKQGYSKHLAEDFHEFIKTVDPSVRKELGASFRKFENAYKNQFHLKNRLCFLTALILTPLLCGIENYIHPKIMNKVYKYEHDHEKIKTHSLFPSISKFALETKMKGAR